MDELQSSLDLAAAYPSNLKGSDTPALILDGIRQELHSQAGRIFCNEDIAAVNTLSAYEGHATCNFQTFRNEDDLRKSLLAPIIRQHGDPLLRIIFFYARSSRDRLNVTIDMARLIFSYHQVMPAFVESLFAFGFREFQQECSSTSFQSRNLLKGPQTGLQVAPLSRSGRTLELCYGLRSVERSSALSDWPWSIRPCSIYHSFDIQSARSTWIVVKANRLVEKLIRDTLSADRCRRQTYQKSLVEGLAESLQIHELTTVWSASNWHWYVGFLEHQLQDMTRPTLSAILETKKVPTFGLQQLTEEPSTLLSASSEDQDEFDLEKLGSLKRIQTTMRSFSSRVSSFRTKSVIDSPMVKKVREGTIERHQFTFTDMPRVHYLEEQAAEAVGTLANNDEVLESLKMEYRDVRSIVCDLPEWQEIEPHLNHFEKVISDAQKTLRQQHTRLQKLLKLSETRKALLDKILTFESIQANQLLAEKANQSAQNMESIAREQRLETVSMRIITLVTLFFLPGTFISTLMSTPIVTFSPGSPSTSDASISAGALGFYVAVSLPLVILTFLAWWIVYWWENRRQRKKVKQEGLEIYS